MAEPQIYLSVNEYKVFTAYLDVMCDLMPCWKENLHIRLTEQLTSIIVSSPWKAHVLQPFP
jgi:hypothetical protein